MPCKARATAAVAVAWSHWLSRSEGMTVTVRQACVVLTSCCSCAVVAAYGVAVVSRMMRSPAPIDVRADNCKHTPQSQLSFHCVLMHFALQRTIGTTIHSVILCMF